MPELTRSQPDKWLIPMRHVSQTQLNPDETLAMILHFEVIKGSEINHTMFAVIRKGNKVIARNILVHDHQDGSICNGHADDMAEYPIENQADLINEVRNHGLAVAVALASGVRNELKLNMEHPAFYLQTPENGTNAGILAKFAENNDPMGIISKKVITSVFGLEKAAFPQLTALSEQLSATPNTTKITKTENEKTNNLARAAKELELINKYGKKQIQALARKMNYDWAGHKYTRKTNIKNKPTQNVN